MFLTDSNRPQRHEPPPQENTEKNGGTIGHGTHVTSTVVGNSKSNPSYNGMAPAGKVAFFDIAKYDNQGNIQLFPPGTGNNYLTDFPLLCVFVRPVV